MEYFFRPFDKSKNHPLLPAVMKPGEILLLTFTIPSIPAEYYEEAKITLREGPDKTVRGIDVGINFSVLNHKGEYLNKPYAASTIYISQKDGYVGHHYGGLQELVH